MDRTAARVATAVAVPLALLAGVATFWWSGHGGDGASAAASASASARPQSSAAVAVPAPTLTGAAASLCRTLLSQLPGSLRTLQRRAVTAGAEQNAAYGDPAITVACGVATPTIEPTAQVWGLSGVCWYAERRPDGTIWTTLDRKVAVQVNIPGGYSAPGQWVTEFSAPILATIGSAPAPTGCA